MSESKIPGMLRSAEAEILADWIKEQTAPGVVRPNLISLEELRHQCGEFLRALGDALRGGNITDISSPAFDPLRQLLGRISESRGRQGFTPSETAIFVLSLKRPLFTRLRRELEGDAKGLFEEVWAATELLDKLGLYTTEVYQKARDQVISRQKDEMLELSTPVVKLWDGILALPLIGTLDSARTQVAMETLLERIVETNSEVAIIDITGVPTVDTLVAQHLMKTVSAARLMGVDCIISGVRPQIAQTIVHLGVALGEIPTRSTLAGAFKLALRKLGIALGAQQAPTNGAARAPAQAKDASE